MMRRVGRARPGARRGVKMAGLRGNHSAAAFLRVPDRAGSRRVRRFGRAGIAAAVGGLPPTTRRSSTGSCRACPRGRCGRADDRGRDRCSPSDNAPVRGRTPGPFRDRLDDDPLRRRRSHRRHRAMVATPMRSATVARLSTNDRRPSFRLHPETVRFAWSMTRSGRGGPHLVCRANGSRVHRRFDRPSGERLRVIRR